MDSKFKIFIYKDIIDVNKDDSFQKENAIFLQKII
jgi:hypothetical protein